jgi:hypothetical protein
MLDRSHWMSHMALPAVSHIFLLAAAVGFRQHSFWALNALNLGVLLLIVTGVINAWEVSLQSILMTPEDIASIEKNKYSVAG